MSSFADLTFPTPKSITGGCLCGGIRYQVDFPPDHDFKKSSGSCQCTQCRRQTGALFFPSHKVAPASTCFRYLITPDNSSPSPEAEAEAEAEAEVVVPGTLKEYKTSPIGARGICATCGSFLYWRPTRSVPEGGTGEQLSVDNDYICLAVGTVDPEYLFGKEGSARDDTGETSRGFGLALANGGGGHSWCVNEIWGVTDRNRMEILGGGVDGRGERRDRD